MSWSIQLAPLLLSSLVGYQAAAAAAAEQARAPAAQCLLRADSAAVFLAAPARPGWLGYLHGLDLQTALWDRAGQSLRVLLWANPSRFPRYLYGYQQAASLMEEAWPVCCLAAYTWMMVPNGGHSQIWGLEAGADLQACC